MNGRPPSNRPISFPARDGFPLRGTVTSVPFDADVDGDDEVATPTEPEPEPDTDHPAPIDDEAFTYDHPFGGPSATIEDPPGQQGGEEPTAPVAATSLVGTDEGTMPTRWGTPDGEEPSRSRGVIIVNGAIGVPHSFYRTFASAFGSAGYTVVTYDYRGIGGSKPRDLRTLDANLSDWVFLDMAAVLSWTTANYPTDRLFLVGHSFGGQVPGLLHGTEGVRAAAAIASQSGYWRTHGGAQKWIVGTHMGFTVPLLARTMRYVPWSRFGGGEDLPRGVAQQWAKWCNDEKYMMADTTLPRERLKLFRAPMISYRFTDDDWGSDQTVDPVLVGYPDVTNITVDPKSMGLRKIGHTGFFTDGAQPLWDDLAAWFDLR